MTLDAVRCLQLEMESSLMRHIINTISAPHDIDGSLKTIILELKNAFEYDAVGIRLQKDDDFPYFASDGFSRQFLATENSLVALNSLGCPARDDNGQILLECSCGLVLSGKLDPADPLASQGGSIWTNNSADILKGRNSKSPGLNPRNVCVHEGYNSLALVPVCDGLRVVGVLQLNDKKIDRFTPEIIKFFEDIGRLLGILLHAKYENEQYRNLFQNTKSAILLADAQTGIIVDANKQAEVLFGRTRTELIGMNRTNLHPQEKRQFYMEQFAEHADEKGARFVEGVIIKKDGTKVPVSIAASVFVINGKRKIQGIFQDLTEIMKLEKEKERKKGDLSVPQFVK